MDPLPFCEPRGKVQPPSIADWLAIVLQPVLGIAVIWASVRYLLDVHEIAAAWVAWLATIATLLGGLGGLPALAWRARGVDVRPILDRPIASRSLRDFWANRWNTAFSDMAYPLVFRPLTKRVGPVTAMLAVFLFSGVLHELFLSVPARGGYGLPTLYFMLHAAGLLIERSSLGRRLHLRGGRTGWLFAAFCVFAPLPLIFHSPFIRNVVLPFLQN